VLESYAILSDVSDALRMRVLVVLLFESPDHRETAGKFIQPIKKT